MKKKLILIIVLFTVTGCTAQYDLVIDESSFNESVTIKAPKESFGRDEIQVYSKQKIPITQEASQTPFYKSSLTEDNSNYYFKFNYSQNIDTINKGYFVTRCYQNANINETNKQIEISTSSEFSCINMDDGLRNDEAQINITTDLKVIKNNADKVNGNTYTWNINEENYKNKPINITMQKKQSMKDVVKNLERNSASKDLFIIYGGLALLLVLIILLVTIKLKNNNKI